MMTGYMAPLVLALSWRSFLDASVLARRTWIAFVLIAISIFLNLGPLFARGLRSLEYYGLGQRSLLIACYGWCLYVSVKLFERASRAVFVNRPSCDINCLIARNLLTGCNTKYDSLPAQSFSPPEEGRHLR